MVNIIKFPKSREKVVDLLTEGAKKHIIYIQFDSDIDVLRRKQHELKSHDRSISLTAVLIYCYAHCISQHKEIQAIRKGTNKLVIFEDVDVAVTIEREMEQTQQPIIYIVRKANEKDLLTIQEELIGAKNQTLGKDFATDRKQVIFFSLPRFLRKIVVKFVRSSPTQWKNIAGTAGFTSIGMYGEGNLSLFPITPTTITLAVGSVAPRPVIKDGMIITHDYLNMVMCSDHDIIDGGPLTRFITNFKTFLQDFAQELDIATWTPTMDACFDNIPTISLNIFSYFERLMGRKKRQPKDSERAKEFISETMNKMTREQIDGIANGVIEALKFLVDNDDDDLLRERMKEYILFFNEKIKKDAVPGDLKIAMQSALETNNPEKLASILQEYAATLTILFPIIEQSSEKLVESYLKWKSARGKKWKRWSQEVSKRSPGMRVHRIISEILFG